MILGLSMAVWGLIAAIFDGPAAVLGSVGLGLATVILCRALWTGKAQTGLVWIGRLLHLPARMGFAAAAADSTGLLHTELEGTDAALLFLGLCMLRRPVLDLHARIAHFHRLDPTPSRFAGRLNELISPEQSLALPGRPVAVHWRSGFQDLRIVEDGEPLSRRRCDDVSFGEKNAAVPNLRWKLFSNGELFTGPAAGTLLKWRLSVWLDGPLLLKDRRAQMTAYALEALLTAAFLALPLYSGLAPVFGLEHLSSWAEGQEWYARLAGSVALLLAGAACLVLLGIAAPALTRVIVWVAATTWTALGLRLVWFHSAWLFQSGALQEADASVSWDLFWTLMLLAGASVGAVFAVVLFYERVIDLPQGHTAEWGPDPHSAGRTTPNVIL